MNDFVSVARGRTGIAKQVSRTLGKPYCDIRTGTRLDFNLTSRRPCAFGSADLAPEIVPEEATLWTATQDHASAQIFRRRGR